jgi:hypothetical protein
VPDFPAQCPDCGAIFPVRGAIGVGEGIRAKVRIGSDVGTTTSCPKCGKRNARISEGLYSANSSAIEIISAPQSTHAALEALKAIAEQAAAGKISKTDAIERAKELDPRYGPLLERYFNLGMPTLAVLVTLLGIGINHHDSVSSADDMKKLLNAAIEQTFVLKDIKREIETMHRPEAQKSPSIVKPVHSRRAQVNSERRHRLKFHRQNFGGARTR